MCAFAGQHIQRCFAMHKETRLPTDDVRPAKHRNLSAENFMFLLVLSEVHLSSEASAGTKGEVIDIKL